jgi:hypothetical protein
MNLNQIPKELIAITSILFGFLIWITLISPPRTQCDLQLELFRKSQTSFAFAEDSKYSTHKPEFEKLLQRCQDTSGPGGCYELFQNLNKFNHDLKALPQQCQKTAGDFSEVKKIFNQSIPLFIQLAWGASPPFSSNVKQGWLDTSEIFLFCKIKEDFLQLYGSEALKSRINLTLKDLPKASQFNKPDQLASLSIASTSCK